MIRDDILEQLRPRFPNAARWQEFLAFAEQRKVRGDAEEIWLQWDIHLLQRQSVQGPWHSDMQHFLPASATAPAQPIL